MGGSNWAVINLAGEIDLARAYELTQVLGKEWHPTQNLLIDLSAVTFMDSAGVRWLFASRRQVTMAGREMRLIVSEGGPVEQLLAIAGVETAFIIYRNLDKALEQIATRSFRSWVGRART